MTIAPRHTTSVICCLALISILSACDTAKYEELKAAEANTGDFSNALAGEYSAFAKSEIDQYDWPDQQYMAEKGLQAAKGGQPLPEKPGNWRISKANQQVFSQPRDDLIHWLNTDARHNDPVRSARAQARFDCWVEQKEENWQTTHIHACKEGLTQALPTISRIDFEFDSARIKEVELETIRTVALDWHNNPGAFLLLQGHADQVGNKKYNYSLSKRRALAVKTSLIAFGVPEQSMRAELWGKTRPRAELTDSKSGRLSNRRVEILKF